LNLKIALFIFLLPCFAFSQNTAKPWAYWWWPASAVNEADIKTNLRKYANAGFGGMHIIPIYGVKGEEQKTIPYMSERWVNILEFTVAEAKKLNLGIDMTLGTGWPFGGSWLKTGLEAQKFELDSINNTFKSLPTLQKVKRASPGAEGYVLDHFNKKAIKNYLQPFDSVFTKKNIAVRAFYNDSYEAYGANWTPDFPKKFLKLRGYSIEDHISTFSKTKDFKEEDLRVLADYKQTISDLLLTEFTNPYASFSKKHNKLSRNEAHGSPANILDLYAAVDIPESEFFGSKPYAIPHYQQDPDYKIDRFGEPDWKVLKLASSPANIMSKKLVSSETATWLGNHFKVMLSQIKPIIDESFLGGINHVFYHGIPYSPPNEPFPGWLFYASTNFNPQSHFWNELPQLNKYVENCQEILQNSVSDNELLVYFPIHDIWQKPKSSLDLVDVHNIKKNGIFTPSYLKLLDDLKHEGVQFDFVSDKQLTQIQGLNGKFGLKNKTYKAILIPDCEILPLESLKELIRLKKVGLKIIFMNTLPKTINGLKNWKSKQIEFDKLKKVFQNDVSENLDSALRKNEIKGETLEKVGLSFIRKKHKDGFVYFISNLGNTFQSGKIKLLKKTKVYTLFDPLKNEYRTLLPNAQNELEIYLSAGKSVFILTYKGLNSLALKPQQKFTNTLALKSPWTLQFTKGEPSIPKSQTMDSLKSWTDADDSLAQYFSGIGNYSTKFELPDSLLKKDFIIDLGDVRASATVTINGRNIGLSWALPHVLEVPKGLLKKENTLEIFVTNTSYNRIRYMDKTGVNWKKFHDINMVDINYQSFNAADKLPEKSGLLGPVVLKY
jgi:alpha-L-rhamnosidase